jgi:thiol-disulfide isomerase/thioredoxin
MEREEGRARDRRTIWLMVATSAIFIALGFRLFVAPLVMGAREDPLHGDSQEASAALAVLIERTPPPQRLAMLLRSANDPSPGLRYASIDALSALGAEHGRAVADALYKAFCDSSSLVRERTLEVLPDIDRERGLRLLLAAIRDDDRAIREAAVIQLRARVAKDHSGIDRRAVPQLIAALSDASPAVVVVGSGVLRKITGKPWRISGMATRDESQPLVRRWRTWWAKTGPTYGVPAEFTRIRPIQPTRMDTAPAAKMRDVSGGALDIPGPRGTITILNFWGTWCPECQEELPALTKIDETYGSRGVRVAGIALNEKGGRTALREWCLSHNVAGQQALARDNVLIAYGNIHDLPVSVLIDGQGRIRYRWEGARDYATFRAAVERMLAEASASRSASAR